jgi:hypothetical protein
MIVVYICMRIMGDIFLLLCFLIWPFLLLAFRYTLDYPWSACNAAVWKRWKEMKQEMREAYPI